MQRVAVVTIYHKNYNYGGLLQAYALQKVLSSEYEAEVVTYKKGSKSSLITRLQAMPLRKFVKIAYNKLYFKLLINRGKNKEAIARRIERFEEFINLIPHTELYTDENIHDLNSKFDYFITGSDQVWNPGWWNRAYFLDFVDDNSKKIAYAASIGRSYLTDDEKQYMKERLTNFKKISVRENDANVLLNSFLDKEVSVQIDPTLLIEKDYWDRLKIDPLINQKYVFLYMLGQDDEIKKEIYSYCKKQGYKIVILPCTKFMKEKKIRNNDCIEMWDVGPREWIGLISNAEMIITDSFHGTVFSIIYHKNVWCFEKDSHGENASENSRLYNLFSILDIENRILTKEKINENKYMNRNINYSSVDEKLEVLRDKARQFLIDSLT